MVRVKMPVDDLTNRMFWKSDENMDVCRTKFLERI